MLDASRRADSAERQLKRRESEAGHLAQRQAGTEAALSAAQEQQAHTAAAAAACQLVLQVGQEVLHSQHITCSAPCSQYPCMHQIRKAPIGAPRHDSITHVAGALAIW